MQDNAYSSREVSNIKMAIGIEGIDFSQYQRYFALALIEKKMAFGGGSSVRPVQLNGCSIDDWKDVEDNFGKLY